MHIRTLARNHYSQVVVGLCVVAIVPFALYRQGLGVLIPFIQEDIGASRAELGLIASGTSLGMAATALLMGRLVDVISVRRLQTTALAWAAVGVLLFSQIQSPLQGLLVGVLIGVAISASFPAYVKSIMAWVTPQARGRAVGITEASMPIVGIIAAVLVTYLGVTLGWRSAVMVLALIIAVSSVVFFVFYRDKQASYSRGGKTRSQLSLVAKNRDIWLVASTGATYSGVQTVVISYLVLYLREYLDMSAEMAGGLLAVMLAGGAFGRFGWALVSDLLLGGRRTAILAFVGMLSGVSMALMVWVPSDASLAVVVVVVFVVGTCTMGPGGLHAVLMAELAGPALAGTAMGIAGTMSHIGTFVITPVFGLIVDRTGSYDMGWWAMAGVVGAGTTLLAFLKPQARRQ